MNKLEMRLDFILFHTNKIIFNKNIPTFHQKGTNATDFNKMTPTVAIINHLEKDPRKRKSCLVLECFTNYFTNYTIHKWTNLKNSPFPVLFIY